MANPLSNLFPALAEAAFSARQTYRRAKRRTRDQKETERTIAAALAGSEPIRLEIGAGERQMPGWLGVDLSRSAQIKMDLREPLPFPDNAVSEIYGSHVLEHFFYDDLMNLLRECFRVLKKGGLLKVSVPNARLYLDGYLDPETFDVEYFCRHKPALNYHTKIDYVNYMAYMGAEHRHLFDEEHLLELLEAAGFAAARLREFDPALDLALRDYESIYAEAEK